MTTPTRASRSTPSGRRAAPAAALTAALGCACAAADAQIISGDVKPMLVLDDRLELRPVQVGGVGETSFIEVDGRGRLSPRSLTGVLALLPRSFDRGAEGAGTAIEPAPVPQDRPWVTLIDGQRIVGSPAGESEQEDALAWRHQTLGTLAFRLDRVMRIALDPHTATPPRDEAPAADDVILLRNGDRLTGFLVAVQPQVEFESGGSTLTIPLERIARIDLINEPVSARGTHVWLADGTRIGVHSLATPQDAEPPPTPPEDDGGAADAPDQGGVTLHLEAPSESPLSETRTVSLHEITAINFDAARIAALTDLPLQEHRPDPSRRRGSPPVIQGGSAEPLGAGDVLLPGPMSVEWSLPDNAVRIAGWVTLPQRAHTWGDCIVTLETIAEDGTATQTATAHVRALQPTVRINTQLPAGADRLRIRLDPGEYGPVQDEVLLQRFILLTQP